MCTRQPSAGSTSTPLSTSCPGHSLPADHICVRLQGLRGSMSARQSALVLGRRLLMQGLAQQQHSGQGLPALQQAAGLPSCSGASFLRTDASTSSSQPQVSAAQYQQSFTSPIHSLEHERGRVQYPEWLESNVLGRSLLRAIGAYGRKQQLNNGACVLYQAIVEQSESVELQTALGLPVGEFMTPYSLLSLHIWLIVNRLKLESQADATTFNQLLYSQYFYKDVERRIYKAGVLVHVGKWQRKLEQQFYGSCLAYDNALSPAHLRIRAMTFEEALLKNVYGDDRDKMPFARLLARYLNRELQNLGLTDIEAIFAGQIKFDQDIIRQPKS